MPHRARRWFTAAVLTTLVGAASGAVTASAAAKKGWLSGAVSDAPAAKAFEPSVVGYQLAPVFTAMRVPVSPSGKFRVKVPAGLYGLVLTSWKGAASVSKARVALVKAGKTAKVATIKASTAPPPMRLSVGRIAVTDPSYAYLKNGLVDVTISDFPFDKLAGCKMGLYEDRKYGRFQDILNEIKLGKSRFADPEFRVMALRAEKNLKANAPTHRLNGVIDSVTQTSAAGTFQLVNLKTGQVEWQQRVEATGDFALFDVGGLAAKALMSHLCDKYPPKLKIDVTGSFEASDDEATARLSATISYVAVARPGEPGNYDLPAPANWTMGASSVDDKPGKCIVTAGAPSQVFPQPASTAAVLRDGVATVYVLPALQVGYVKTEPPPPLGPLGSCNGPTAVAVSQGALPGITFNAPLNVATSVNGAAANGTFNATVTVTPLSE